MSILYNNRILVIDDDQSILDIFKSVLTRKDYSQEVKLQELKALLRGPKKENTAQTFQVETAQQGELGFEMVKEACANGMPFAAIFVDMRMPPGWDGVQTIKAIREYDPSVQIVIVTAFSDANIAEIVNQVGFSERLLYLKKPFDDQEILQLADSLATRWNLEKRISYFDEVLESIVGSLGELDFLAYENTLKTFLGKILAKMGEFLGTNDLLLGNVVDGELVFKVGLGRFSDGFSGTPTFKEMIKKAFEHGKTDELIRIEEFLIMPMTLRSTQNVVIGVMNVDSLEATDSLLTTMAASSAHLFKQGTRLADLCLEVEKLREREQQLRDQLRELTESTEE